MGGCITDLRQLYLNDLQGKESWNARDFFQGSSSFIKSDRQCVLATVRKCGDAFQFADANLKADPKFVLEVVNICSSAFQFAGSTLKANRNFILAVVQIDGNAFQFADKRLKADREFVLEVVQVHFNALHYVNEQIQADVEILKAAKESYLRILDACDGQEAHELLAEGPEPIKADRDCVLATVSKAGIALQCASIRLKRDKEVVLAAVRNHGNALNFADDALQADAEVQTRAKEAYLQNLKGEDCRGAYKLLKDAPEAIREDRECLMATLQITGSSAKMNRSASHLPLDRFRSRSLK